MKILNDLPLGTFDLHIHTTASDGVYSPYEIVEKSKMAGLTTIAVTDHDTLEGVSEAVEAGKKLGIHVIPGVEISTRYQGRNVDVLGYNIVDVDFLHQTLQEFRLARENRALKIIDKFCELGMPITLEEVRFFSGEGVIARPHIAKAIVRKGYLPDPQTVFDKYLADGKPASVDKKMLTPEEGIRWIHQSGGQAVLAHPVHLGNDDLVEELLSLGFDGLEVWHRQHTSEKVNHYLKLAEKHHLFVTGGSDFHGDEHVLGLFGGRN